jgi:hypothetical protein
VVQSRRSSSFFHFGTIPLAVVIGVILIAIALSKVRRHRLAVFGMICVFLALAWSLFRSADSLRTNARWLAHSQIYKQQVLKQQTPRDGLLKHMEWDGWGFPGAGDTVVYLVLEIIHAESSSASLARP